MRLGRNDVSRFSHMVRQLSNSFNELSHYDMQCVAETGLGVVRQHILTLCRQRLVYQILSLCMSS